MELDELKSQLKNKLATDHTGVSDADIASLLNKRTLSVVGKLKKSLRFEIKFTLVVLIVFAGIGLFSNSHVFKIYFSVFFVFLVAVLFVLFYLLKRTQKRSSTILPVKANLQAIVHLMEELIKRYFQLTMLLIPVCFLFSLWLGYNDIGGFPTLSRKFAKGYFSATWQIVAFSIAYMGVIYVIAYYTTKWYLRKLYGRYVAQLKECISDLSEE